MGTFGSVAFSVTGKSRGNLDPAGAFTQWEPLMGPGDTVATGPEVKSIGPSIVIVFKVDIALARAALFDGSPLAVSAAAPASNSASVAPSCCVHILPEPFS